MRAYPAGLLERVRTGGEGLHVLVLRLGALGDVLRTLPSLRALRAGLPCAEVSWVVDEAWAAILKGHPDVNRVIPMPRSAWRETARSPLAWPSLAAAAGRWIQMLRERRPDVVLDFHGNLRSGFVALSSGAPVRVGHSGHQQKEGNFLFTTHRVPSGPRRVSRVERNLDLVRSLGIPAPSEPAARLPIFADANRAAARIVHDAVGAGRPYAVVSPGASHGQSYKKPPVPLLAAAISRLSLRGIASLVVHGPGERETAQEAVCAAPEGARLAPSTDLFTLAALLAEARVFVGGDSGPLHLACATGCPVLGLYGPTDPVVNAPWGVPHLAVQPDGRSYTGIKRLDRAAGGFQGLEPLRVSQAVDEILEKSRSRWSAPGPRSAAEP